MFLEWCDTSESVENIVFLKIPLSTGHIGSYVNSKIKLLTLNFKLSVFNYLFER